MVLKQVVWYITNTTFFKKYFEGKRGAIWNFLRAFWYRFLVDVIMYEAYKATGMDRDKLIEYFQKEYGY